jgi:RHS repeat-associated protein
MYLPNHIKILFSPFSFQGQEHDDELKGEGNSVNYKYRMHDPRVGRFFAIDPLASDYPHNSPYAFSENVVINCVELEGLEKIEKYTPTKENLNDYYKPGTKLDTRNCFPPQLEPWNYVPKRNSKGNVVIENTDAATMHYFFGNGESVDLSWGTQNGIFNSEDMMYYRERIKSGKTSSPASGTGLPVNVESESTKLYHVGRIAFSYKTTCTDGTCTTEYTFSGDGYWDIFTGEDKQGPDGEIGGHPYKYNTFVKTETYPNPGYPVDKDNIPSANEQLEIEGTGPPNESDRN